MMRFLLSHWVYLRWWWWRLVVCLLMARLLFFLLNAISVALSLHGLQVLLSLLHSLLRRSGRQHCLYLASPHMVPGQLCFGSGCYLVISTVAEVSVRACPNQKRGFLL